jgi:hypothetical protein
MLPIKWLQTLIKQTFSAVLEYEYTAMFHKSVNVYLISINACGRIWN